MEHRCKISWKWVAYISGTSVSNHQYKRIQFKAFRTGSAGEQEERG
jgi:hypothetical protein